MFKRIRKYKGKRKKGRRNNNIGGRRGNDDEDKKDEREGRNRKRRTRIEAFLLGSSFLSVYLLSEIKSYLKQKL